MSGTILEVKGLSVRRERIEILREVDLSIHAGEHWLLFGPNGCGKTSLLLSITGYLMPSAGSIRVLDCEYGHFDWRELRRAIGIVSSAIRQKIEDHETGLALVAGGREAILNTWKPVRKADRAEAEHWMHELGVSRLAEREWRCFSAGERQRLLIARALMAKPKILILDESCAGLDPVARERFLERLDRLAAHPAAPAILFVTHHVEEIRPWISHCLLLRQGRRLAAGSLQNVLTSRYLSECFEAPVKVSRRPSWAVRVGE